MVERGIGRVQFLALWPQIKEQLEAGYPVTSIYKRFETQLAIKRRRFNDLVRTQHRSKIVSSPTLRSAFSSATPPSNQIRNRSRSAVLPITDKKPRSFKHNPQPDQELIDSLKVRKGGGR